MMRYATIRRKENVMSVIRMVHHTSHVMIEVTRYATRRDAQVYEAHESEWDNAVSFNLYPCIEYDGIEFITIHEPDQDSL